MKMPTETFLCAPQAANVLINTDGRVVLSDFGVTANLERIVPSPRVSMSSPRASTSSPRSPISALGSLPEDSQLLNASAHRCGSKDSGVSLASSGGSLGAAAAADASAAAAAPPAEPVQAQPVPAASPCAAAEVQQVGQHNDAPTLHVTLWECTTSHCESLFGARINDAGALLCMDD